MTPPVAAAYKPRVFIGSSREHLDLANAVQVNLEHDVESRVWNQGIFHISEYPLDALLTELDQCDFGIFVLAPADVARIHGRRLRVPRDNVVFELGLFAGRLGREAVFVVAPRGESVLHLPTDLEGLIIGDYDPAPRDRNLFGALGPICTRIRGEIRARTERVLTHRPGLVSSRLFNDYVGTFAELLESARHLSVYFIHSRRWRENHNDSIIGFLRRSGTRLEVFLPNLANRRLIEFLQSHFDDGPHIPGFIADAYRYFSQLARDHTSKVSIRLYDHYPTYSFYNFDNESIIAFYPNTPVRRAVPAFQIRNDSPFGSFLQSEISKLRRMTKKGTLAKLRSVAKDS